MCLSSLCFTWRPRPEQIFVLVARAKSIRCITPQSRQCERIKTYAPIIIKKWQGQIQCHVGENPIGPRSIELLKFRPEFAFGSKADCRHQSAAGFAAIAQLRAKPHWPSGQFNRDCGLVVSVVDDDLAPRKSDRPRMETRNRA